MQALLIKQFQFSSVLKWTFRRFTEVKEGNIYQHYRNKEFYQVLQLDVTHTETEELMIVYQAITKVENNWIRKGKKWGRPKKMFVEILPEGPRFKLIEFSEESKLNNAH